MKTRITDRAYLDWLRTQPCIINGTGSNWGEAVDPAHIGTFGRGVKTDDEALPLAHSLHMLGHQKGEMTMWRENMPDWLLREALRVYAREFYAKWKADHG